MNQIKLTEEAACGAWPPVASALSKARTFGGDGKPTGETDGYRLSIVAPGRDFAAITVKLPEGGVDLGGMTGEDISAANANGKFVYVGFEGFTAKAYVGRDGNLGITATAARAFLVDASGKPENNMPGAIPGGGKNHA